MRKKMAYAVVTIDDDNNPIIASVPSDASRVVLIVNTHRVVIRVADLAAHKLPLDPAAEWQLVQEHFPFGPVLDENTHIFDGSVFDNADGGCCFMMAALPRAVSEAAAKIGIEQWGSVHKLERLDTIEHMLFRHYVDKNPKPLWIVFPQDLGFRVLSIDSGLPKGAHYIRNHPVMREVEFDRAWQVDRPGCVVLLASDDGSEDKYLWLRDLLHEWGAAEVIEEPFSSLPWF